MSRCHAKKWSSFFITLVTTLCSLCRFDDEVVKLIKVYCVPILTYAIKIVHLAHRNKRHSLRVVYISVFITLSAYRTYESLIFLQHFLGPNT